MQKELSLKLLLIFAVGLLVYIPVSMVAFKVDERRAFQQHAKQSVEKSWTGPQKLLSPIIVIPYRLSPNDESGFVFNEEPSSLERLALLLPDKVDIQTNVSTKHLVKGIYNIPVFNSEIELNGAISASKIQAKIHEIKQTPRFEVLGQAYLSVHVGDVRGLDKIPTIAVNGEQLPTETGSRLLGLPSGIHVTLHQKMFSGDDIKFDIKMALRGTETLSFIPAADSTRSKLVSNWPHPEFIGVLLPEEREVGDGGFSSRWYTTKYSNRGGEGVQTCLHQKSCGDLAHSAYGVRFIEPVDIYLQTERAIKYAMLFIGLSFVTFVIFEHLKQVRIHPIQYAFVGLSIAVFYLLLISLAEHVSFAWSYLIAGVCCSGLLLFYVRYILRSLKAALFYFSMIVGLLAALYVIIQAEDFAMLMGACLVFIILAALMIVTHKIDWYEVSSGNIVERQVNSPD